MTKYQVKRGVRFGMANLEWPAIVEMRPHEAQGFLDLLELVTEPEDEPARIVVASEVTEPGAVADLEPEPAPAPAKPAGRKKA